MQEIWKDIEGYEGLYQVSNKGRVKSLSRLVVRVGKPNYITKEKILKCSELKGTGYPAVKLGSNNNFKSMLVHRLVAQAFIPNPDNLPCVNHKDETRNNNDVRNLEWCTQKYNCNYGTARQRNSLHNKGKKLSQETKDKMSASRKGKKHSIEWCEKISLSNKGKVPSNKGKKMSEEQKEKIRNSVKKSWELRKKGMIEHDKS